MDPSPGDSYRFKLGGQSLSGQVVQSRVARRFAGTVEELNEGLLFIDLESSQKNWHCGVWLSVYAGVMKRIGTR